MLNTKHLKYVARTQLVVLMHQEWFDFVIRRFQHIHQPIHHSTQGPKFYKVKTQKIVHHIKIRDVVCVADKN
jgi:hypothetical protein